MSNKRSWISAPMSVYAICHKIYNAGRRDTFEVDGICFQMIMLFSELDEAIKFKEKEEFKIAEVRYQKEQEQEKVKFVRWVE